MLVRGAHGDFSNLTTKSTVIKRQASSNFTPIKRNQGGTFRNSRIQLGFRESKRTGQRRGSFIYFLTRFGSAGVANPKFVDALRNAPVSNP